jgi:hypothetical protein
MQWPAAATRPDSRLSIHIAQSMCLLLGIYIHLTVNTSQTYTFARKPEPRVIVNYTVLTMKLQSIEMRKVNNRLIASLIFKKKKKNDQDSSSPIIHCSNLNSKFPPCPPHRSNLSRTQSFLHLEPFKNFQKYKFFESQR